jgi:hypothetical protein
MANSAVDSSSTTVIGVSPNQFLPSDFLCVLAAGKRNDAFERKARLTSPLEHAPEFPSSSHHNQGGRESGMRLFAFRVSRFAESNSHSSAILFEKLEPSRFKRMLQF